jgi:hypothetical protein
MNLLLHEPTPIAFDDVTDTSTEVDFVVPAYAPNVGWSVPVAANTLFAIGLGGSSMAGKNFNAAAARSDSAQYEVIIVPGFDDEREHLNGIRGLVSRIWAQDWDSDEDAVYDSW